MTTNLKLCTIYYRKCSVTELGDVGDKTLEALVRQSLNAVNSGNRLKDNFNLRVWDREGNGQNNLFCNHYEEYGNPFPLIFGDLIHFDKDHMQALITLQGGPTIKAKAEMSQIPPPENKKYIHSQMFWMIILNHLFVLESNSLRTVQLEEYLTWLIKKHYSPEPTGKVVLLKQFNKEEVGGDLSNIRELIIGASAERIIGAAPPDESQMSLSASHGSTGLNTAVRVMEALFGNIASAHDALRGIPEGAKIKVTVHLGYKGLKRKSEAQPLKGLEKSLRNLDDAEFSVISKNGRETTGGKLVLHHKAYIKRVFGQSESGSARAGNLLEIGSVLEAMTNAYKNMRASGKISQ